MVHLTRANTYLFHKDGKKMTLHPLKEDPPNTKMAAKTNNLLRGHEFQPASQEMGVVFALVAKDVQGTIASIFMSSNQKFGIF